MHTTRRNFFLWKLTSRRGLPDPGNLSSDCIAKNTDCSWFSCTGYRSMSLLLVLQVVLRRPKSQKRSSLSLRNVWNFMTPWRLAWQDFCFPFVAFSGRCNCLSTVDSCGRLSVLFDLLGHVAVQSIYSHRLGFKPSLSVFKTTRPSASFVVLCCLCDPSEWAYSARLCSVATAENLLSRAVVEFVSLINKQPFPIFAPCKILVNAG